MSSEVDGVMPEKVDISFSKVDDTFLDRLAQYVDQMQNMRERYILNWSGRGESFVEAGRPLSPAKTLRPNVEESVNFDTTKNLFITGDNLEALKLLQESYLGKVDMIYIDPPYNTGSDFIYHDDFKKSRDEEIDESRDEDGNRQFTVNTKDNGRYHSDWLSMMYPRLILARNFLSDKGVIFISIDEHEQANLQIVCNDVFGSENFIGVAPRKTRGSATTKGDADLQSLCDYVVIYTKNKRNVRFNKKIVGQKSYPYHDDRGDFYIVPLQDNGPHGTREARPNLWYPIYRQNDGTLTYEEPANGYSEKILPAMHQNKEGCWMWSKKKFDTDSKDLFVKDGRVYIKHYNNPDEDQNRYQFEKLMLSDMQNSKGTLAVNALFGAKGLFSNPKPVELIKWCEKLATNKQSLIMDFFAGSGTTAQAVMQQNADDGGHRNFILVQLPEVCSEKSEAFKAGYKTIDELSRERIRRAALHISATDKNADSHDYGFRSLHIDLANENDGISMTPQQTQQSMLDQLVNNIREERTPLDLLFGVLLSKGWSVDREIKRMNVNGNEVLCYDHMDDAPGTGVVACFDERVNQATIERIIDMAPQAAVFRDSSFATSNDKMNLVEQFRTLQSDGIETKVWVI